MGIWRRSFLVVRGNAHLAFPQHLRAGLDATMLAIQRLLWCSLHYFLPGVEWLLSISRLSFCPNCGLQGGPKSQFQNGIYAWIENGTVAIQSLLAWTRWRCWDWEVLRMVAARSRKRKRACLAGITCLWQSLDSFHCDISTSSLTVCVNNCNRLQVWIHKHKCDTWTHRYCWMES